LTVTVAEAASFTVKSEASKADSVGSVSRTALLRLKDADVSTKLWGLGNKRLAGVSATLSALPLRKNKPDNNRKRMLLFILLLIYLISIS
jgi:hypothetical protein